MGNGATSDGANEYNPKAEWAALVQFLTPRMVRFMAAEDCGEITIHWRRNTAPKVKVTHSW